MKNIFTILILLLTTGLFAQDMEIRVTKEDGGNGNFIVQMAYVGSGTAPAMGDPIQDISFALRWPATANLDGMTAINTPGYGLTSGGPEEDNGTGAMDYSEFNLSSATVFQSNWVTGTFYDIMEFQFDTPPPNGTVGDIEIAPVGTAPNPGTPFVLALASGALINENPLINGSNPLPVEIISFETLKRGEDAVFLTWSTANQIDFSHFTLERSFEGTDWSEITKVEGQANSSSVADYDFLDADIPLSFNSETTAYYRLKMVDLNGDYAYSEIRSETFEARVSDVNVYPNPTADYITVDSEEEVSDISIFNIDGKLVLNIKNNTAKIDLSQFDAGMYKVIVTTEAGQTVKSVVKMQ